FFEGAVSEQTPTLFAEHLPGARNQAIAAAEAICQRRFDLLGYRGLFFGDPVDWHLDPISGRRARRTHWSQINPLDRTAVGDSKVIWGLNRHQWLVFPELRAADRWRKVGTRILIEQSERQILADGVYFEQSACYQRYTAEIYLHLLVLAARNGIEIPTSVQARIQRLLDFLLAIRLP